MAGGNNVEVHINGDEDVSAAAAKAAAAIDSLKDKKITVEVNVDDKKAKKALENIDKKVKEIGNGVGDFDLNTRKARDKLTYLHERAKALGDLETEIDVDTRKARDKLTYLHNRHKEIGENKPELDFDTSKARDKLSYLKSRFSEIFSDKPEVDINTKKARDKLSKLGSRLKEVTNVKQEIDVDTEKARAKLLDLNSIGKEIESIKIDVDIEDAIENIEDLTLLLNSIRDKTINIDVDSAGALAQISAIDSALHGIDRRKQVEVDVDVNDVDMQLWQSELDALNRNKRRLENNPYDLTIPADVEVDDKRIKELEKRIADKKNTIKVKTELDNSELEDAGIKDKKVKIDVEINGLERLVALRAVIASLEDKTININVNSDSKGIDKLTNTRNGVTRPIIQSVKVKYDTDDYNKLNRILAQGTKDMNARNNRRAQDFLSNTIDASAERLHNAIQSYKGIDKNNSINFANIAPQKIRVLVDDKEVKRYKQSIDELERDKQFIGPEIEGRKLAKLVKMRQELERLETLGKSTLTPQTGKNGLVDLGRQRAKLRKQISDFEKDFDNNPVQIAAEMAVNDRRIKDLTQKLENRQKQLGDPFKDIKIDDTALKNFKKSLKETNIKIKSALDRDNAISELKKQKAEIERIPVKIRTEADNNSLRTITKDLKNLENIKRQSASLDKRLADKNRYQQEIKSIKAVRTALNDANNLKLKEIRIVANADTRAAAAKFDALTRPRDVDINVNESRLERVTRVFRQIGDSAVDSGRRFNRAFSDDNNGFTRTLRGVGRLSDGINKGIGSMTSRIPLVGGLFNALGSLGGQAGSLTTKLSSMAGMGTKTAGAMGAVVQSVISVGSAMVGLGIIGTVGTGLITAGAYAATAALGTVAGVAGAVGAALGGGAIAGFAMLVKDAPEVQEAYSKLGDTVGETMKRIAEPVKIPIVEAAPKLQAAFDQVSPSISRIASQTGNLIDSIGDQLPAVAKEAGPALEKAFNFGETSLKTLMSNMPAITKSVGEFFGKLDGPEVRKAVDGAFAAIPGIIGGIGTGIEKASAGFNNLQEFMGSDRLEPMREGFEKFSQSLSATDWSSASDGIATAMNSFGKFAGEFDMQNISDGIGSFANGLATLTDIGTAMNLDGLFSGLGKAFSGFATVAEGAGTVLANALKPITEPVKAGFDMLGWINDNVLGGNEKVNVDGPSIELNPNISVADQDQADIAKDILANIDGKSFGSADAADRIINDLNNDISKLEVKPEVKGILDQNTIAKNVNAENIGKLLQNRIGEDKEPVKIPIQTAMDIETAAGKDGLNVQDSIKDQLSKLTGIAVEDLNIEVGVGTTFKVAKNADGSLGDLIKGTIDDAGNLSIEVVATANVVAQIAGVTGLDGAALDSALGGIFDGQTISQELAVQIKANMGLADASMSDFESALEGKLAGINGQNYDVILNADGTVNITIKDPAIPPIPPPPPLPDLNMQQKATIALQFDMKYTEFSALTEELKSLGAQGGESIEITKEMQVNLEAVVGGGTSEEVQQKIKELISGLTGIAVEDLDITFDVNATLGSIKGVTPSDIKGLVEGAAAGGPITLDKELFLNLSTELGTSGMNAGEIEGLIEGFLGNLFNKKIDITVPVEIKPEAKFDGENFLASFDGASGKGIGIPLYYILPEMPVLPIPPAIGIPSNILPPTIPPMPVLPTTPWPTTVEPPTIPPVTLPPLRQKLEVEMGPMPKIPDSRSVHHVQVTSDPAPSFPNTTSGHHVSVSADPLPSYPDTSSTHTVRVNVVGSAGGGIGESAKTIMPGTLGGAMSRGIAPMSMGAVGPMGASGISSGGRGVSAIRQTGVDIANSLADGLASGVGAVDKAANELAQAAGAIGPQVDKYLSSNSPEYNEAKRIGADVVNNIAQGITGAQAEIGKAMDGVNKFISDPLGEIDKALSANVPGYDVAKKQVQEFVTGVETTMSGLGEAAKVGTDGFQKIIAEEFVLPPMDQVIAKAQEIGDGIGAALMGDPTKLAGTMDGIGSAISSKIGVVSGKVGAVMDQVNQTMRDKVPGFADAQDKAIEFGNGLAAGVENARLQMNQQLTTMGLPTIPTPQMAIDGINAEVVKAKTAIDQGFALLAPPIIPAPQMAAEGLAAGIQKIKTDIDTGLSMLKINAPAPVIPAPDLGPVKQALSTIPGAIDTVNKVESDIKVAKANLDSIPEQVKTENTIEGNIKAVIAQIAGLAGMDTTSTHTVNVVQQGAGIPKGAGASRGIANNAMGAMSMGGVSALSSTAMGAPVGIGPAVSRGTVGLELAVGGLAIGGLLLGLGALFAGLFAILGAFSNNIGKLKLNDIDGGSYRPEGVINHYYYQTTQNNHFDGGLVGDPELQGKRVLEVLQSAPNGRQFRNQLGAST
jgi:hypothetical protein